MSDMNFDEGEPQEQAAPSKRKGLGGLPILKILMFAGIGAVAIGLIVLVINLTIRSYNDEGRATRPDIRTSEEYVDVPPVYAYSASVPEVRTKTSDIPPATVVAKVILCYDKGNKALETEISDRIPQLRDRVRVFFLKKKADELGPDAYDDVRNELKETLNNITENKGIREILFEKYDVITE